MTIRKVPLLILLFLFDEGQAQYPWPNFHQVAGNIFDYSRLQGPEMHNNTLKMMLEGIADLEVKKRAGDMDLQWQAGRLPIPCVWIRRMAFVQLQAGGVLAYSPVELTPDVEVALQKLGGVKVIVLPNSEHAIHWESWKKAWPEAPLVMPAQISDQMRLPSWAGTPFLLKPREAIEKPLTTLLEGFETEVIGQSGFNEIVLFHRSSRTLLTADFMYFGTKDRKDESGWVNLGSCTELYYEAFVKPAPSGVLLPTYRLYLSEEDKQSISLSLRCILSWGPQRILSAHAGKVSEGGAKEAAEMLHSAWDWCDHTSFV